MKSLTDVNKNRLAYHKDPNRNTVHRSSLIVPVFAQAAAHISFLNHFLIKRAYPEVTLKVTALDAQGLVIDSLSLPITERRVYSFQLDVLLAEAVDVRQYLVEFFSTRNLFIPFPAVMVNHVGADFINAVHSYNRVLNDIFEDDAINGKQVYESSLDYAIDDDYDTFFNFASGPFKPAGQVEAAISEPGHRRYGSARLDMPRLSNQNHFISALLDDAREVRSTGVLKIRQPQQAMFYGRLLAGIINRKSGAFSANHSYYDSSDVDEYFPHAVSHRVYPYFRGELNRVTMYPIMSPSTLDVHIEFMHGDGTTISSSAKVRLVSPSDRNISLDVDAIARALQMDDATTFRVVATAVDGKTPSRVTHQLIYGAGQSRSKLLSTIAIGLSHAQALPTSQKPAITWGQMIIDSDYRSYVGICFFTFWGEAAEVTVDFYDQNGLIKSIGTMLWPGMSLIVSDEDFRDIAIAGKFVWFNATSTRADLSSASFHAHKTSHHASGEHGF